MRPASSSSSAAAAPTDAATACPLQAAELEAARAAEHTALCAQFATPEIWEQYKDTVSSGPAKWTLARAINSGVRYPSSFVGCHAGDSSSYDDFKDFFYPVIQAYHKGFDIETTKHVTDMDPSKISTKLTDTAKSKIISTRIRVARNLAMFPLNPGASTETRPAICDMMEKVYGAIDSSSDLSGDMFRHTTMSDEQRQGLIDDHFLFRGKDKMQAASGYHEYWPEGRGVFHNKSKTFVNWLNEGDHLRIISMEQGGDVLGVFTRLAEGAKLIEEGIKKETGEEAAFMMHPIFGSLTCCPSNIGTGMRGSVHILVPKLIAAIGFDAIDKMCRERNCQARGSSGEHSAVVDRIDVSNWRRIGFPEYELVHDMIKCANFLAEEEDKLPDPEAAAAAAPAAAAPAPAPKPTGPVSIGTQLTLAIIKPDAVAAGHAPKILGVLKAQGFTVVQQALVTMDAVQCSRFYAEHASKPWFGELVELMTSGPCMPLCLARANAVSCLRGLLGPTNADEAKTSAPGSIRALYGSSGAANACHGSKNAEAAASEVGFWFPRIAGTTLLSTEAARQQLQEQVAPLLSVALVELAKAKPQDPMLWLAMKLKELNPEKPPESVQSGYDLAKAEGARAIFSLIDSDGDGAIDKLEFRDALMRLGVDLTQEMSDMVFGQIDRNDNGTLSQSEFVEAFFHSMSLGM